MIPAPTLFMTSRALLGLGLRASTCFFYSSHVSYRLSHVDISFAGVSLESTIHSKYDQ